MLHYEFVSVWTRSKAKTERGASLVEYSLLVALIAAVCIAGVSFLGREVGDSFSSVGSGFQN